MSTAVAPTRPQAGAADAAQRLRAAARSGFAPFVVLVTVGWWVLAAARDWGGRGPGVLSVGAGLTAVAVIVSGAHRWLPRRVLLLAGVLSLTAVVVAAAAPTGWAGIADGGSYVCFAWTALAVAAGVARRAETTERVALVVAAAVAVEFAEAWLPWWGGRNPALPMMGTFYWHDPFAAFMAAGALVSLGVWLTGRGAVAALGVVGFVLGVVAVVFSTSRAGQAGLAVGVVGVVALAGWCRHRARRVLGAIVATVAATLLVSGPPFFPVWRWFGSGTALRASGQSLARNGGFRVDFWREAWGVFTTHPLTGGGYHSMATLSAGHVPAGWPLSPLAHNGYLQAFSDGGVLLGVPFLACCLAVAWLAVAALAGAVRERRFRLDTVAVPVAALFLLGHSLVDFDWSYPANLMLTAALAGLLLGRRLRTLGGAGEAPHRRQRWGMALAAVGVGLLVVVAASATGGDLRLNLPVAGASAGGAG